MNKKQALSVLKDVDILYVPVLAEWAPDIVRQAHTLQKKCVGVHPLIDHAEVSAIPECFDGEMFATLTNTNAEHKIADVSFNVMNSETLRALRELGYERATVSADLNLAQIRDLTGYPAYRSDRLRPSAADDDDTLPFKMR